jgi:hypothetical protein
MCADFDFPLRQACGLFVQEWPEKDAARGKFLKTKIQT